MAKKTVESKGYDNGYNDAIEKIKQMLSGMSGMSGGDGENIMPDPNLNMPEMDDQNNQGNQDGSGKSGDSNDQNPQSGKGNQSNNSSSKSSKSSSGRDADGSGKTGVVRPEDCTPIGNISNTAKEPGGMIDKKTGDEVAQKEGYSKEGGTDSSVEKDWKDAALKEIKNRKWTGDGGPGGIATKISNIYKVSTDWKKELRNIVGHSISQDDSRRAYAHKNTLVSQDRVARTDKDKYDSMSYMVIILDTSGSMWNDKIRQMMREAYQVAIQKKPIRIMTIQNDADIQDVQIHNNLRDFEKYVKTITMKGGGGNDLRPAWDFLKKGHPKFMKEFSKIKKAGPAELVMNFTDGFLTQLKRDPKTMKNLCWAIIDNPNFDIEHKDAHTKRIIIKND